MDNNTILQLLRTCEPYDEKQGLWRLPGDKWLVIKQAQNHDGPYRDGLSVLLSPEPSGGKMQVLTEICLDELDPVSDFALLERVKRVIEARKPRTALVTAGRPDQSEA